MTVDKDKCKHFHKSEPVDYIGKSNWLEKMSKRYDQVKCPKCGLYVIWKKKGNL